jgi:hypothetical protein
MAYIAARRGDTLPMPMEQRPPTHLLAPAVSEAETQTRHAASWKADRR